MNYTLKYLLLPCLLLVSLRLSAHQPELSSTLLVEQSEGDWILQIRAALTGFEYEVEYTFGQDSYSTPEAFQELLVKHVLENVSIIINEKDQAQLNNGQVKLGHETSITFEVVGIPEMIQSLQVKNSSFRDISRNQSALIVLKNDFEKEQFTLNNENNHTVNLIAKNAKFELFVPIPKGIAKASSKSLLIILGISFFLGLGFLLSKKLNLDNSIK